MQVITHAKSDEGLIRAVAGWASDMDTYDFTLILDLKHGLLTNEVYEAFFDAGLDDALIGSTAGVLFADVSREAEDFITAVTSAIKDVERSGVGATVVRVEPDDLVTVADIAQRLGRSSESIRLLIRGARGPGDFPPPITRLGGRRSRVWRWADVSGWFEQYDPQSQQSAEPAHWSVIAGVNDVLRQRELTRRRDPVISQVRRALRQRSG